VASIQLVDEELASYRQKIELLRALVDSSFLCGVDAVHLQEALREEARLSAIQDQNPSQQQEGKLARARYLVRQYRMLEDLTVSPEEVAAAIDRIKVAVADLEHEKRGLEDQLAELTKPK